MTGRLLDVLLMVTGVLLLVVIAVLFAYLMTLITGSPYIVPPVCP